MHCKCWMMTSLDGNIFLRYWSFMRWPVNSPHKGQWRGDLIFSLVCDWMDGWVNDREADELRRHRIHYEVIVMWGSTCPVKCAVLLVCLAIVTSSLEQRNICWLECHTKIYNVARAQRSWHSKPNVIYSNALGSTHTYTSNISYQFMPKLNAIRAIAVISIRGV